ncbi:MAG: TldD/PmbA family protein, partial [Dehalococcoidia bacterium]|nr:TldD/PmbA family protein [Dehalococcoidia bacterium]
MKDLATRALDTAKSRGATYADIRIIYSKSESITAKNGKVEALAMGESQGFGIRVIAEGAWGFASSGRLTTREVDRVAALAVRTAQASATVKHADVDIGPPSPTTGRYSTAYQIDPFAVSLEEKINLLMAADQAMRRVKGIRVAESAIEIVRENKAFASTEGSMIEQEITKVGCGIEAMAEGQGDVQNRSYPNSVGRHHGSGGWEFVQAQDLPGNGQRIAEEAVALLTAKPCPSGTTTLILDATQLALQLHESCGHPIELDRVLGSEASYAGTSFLTIDKLGKFRYGSDLVNITADATLKGGLGSFGYDDEGVPAQRIPIVRGGLFLGYLTSRETARVVGQTSNGTMRADGWNRIPLIRM